MEKLHDSFRLSKSNKHSNASFSFSCLELSVWNLGDLYEIIFFFFPLSPTYIFNTWTSVSDRCDFMPIPPFLYGFGQCKLLQQC